MCMCSNSLRKGYKDTFTDTSYLLQDGWTPNGIIEAKQLLAASWMNLLNGWMVTKHVFKGKLTYNTETQKKNEIQYT